MVHTKHWSAVEPLPYLLQLSPDDYGNSELGPLDEDTYEELLDYLTGEALKYCCVTRVYKVCPLLKHLGATVSRVECFSNENGTYIYAPYELAPHAPSCGVSQNEPCTL